MLDHFFWNETTKLAAPDAGVLHIPENLSDHCPIYCTVNFGLVPVQKSLKNNVKRTAKPNWKKATEDEKANFAHNLDEQLSMVEIPESIYCTDVKCKEVEHCNKADDFITNILECVEHVASSSLPSQSPPAPPQQSPARRPVPGWKNVVKPFRDKAHFWHQIWISAGKPINTELHRIMKRSRNVYHYHYRKCKKSEETIVKNKLLDACINKGGDIFKEIKKLRATKPTIAASMDGVHNDIAGHFKGIYKDLYNSVNDHDEVDKIAEDAEAKVNFLSLVDVEKVTPEVVKKAASHLKDSKSDPTFSFNSDCVKNGTDQLFEKLALSLKSFLIHGHITYFLLLATLLPHTVSELGRKFD